MHKKPFKNTIVVASVTLLLVISLSLSASPTSISYAFLGFDLGGGIGGSGGSGGSGTDQSIGNSQKSIQGAHCYSPNASIVDSCNSGDGSDSENLGHNFYGQ
jgi:hypothetical protein